MKPRGVAFAIEAVSSIVDSADIDQQKREEIYNRLERVVLIQVDEFIPHYLIKMLCAFTKAGQGSGEIYDQLIQRIVAACLVQPTESD